MIKLGYQIPLFTYPNGTPETLFESVAAQALAAEAHGFDTVMVMDHLYQLPGLGDPEDYMMECYTLLGALAARTSTIKLGSLVTGNTYRNPALLAKIITTLDVVSQGRAILGIGAGWFELEHDSLGFTFNTFTERFEKLEEALQIIPPMLAGQRPTFSGQHYSVTDAINQPPPIGKIPLMIGGGGEKKTLRMVAQYADASNLICNPDEISRKLDVLDQHCQQLGRARSEISVSWQSTVIIAPTLAEAEAERTALLARRGFDWDSLDEGFQNKLMQRIIMGGPDEVRQQVQEVLALGIDGLPLNMPANGHHPEIVALAGQTLAPLFSSD